MHPFSAILRASVASCVLASCETPASKTQTSSSSPSASSAAAALSSGSEPLDLLTSQIDTTITLDVWLKSHPGDEISLEPVVSGIDDPFCRGAVAKAQLMGRKVVRSALFYIPTAPKGETLPTDTTKVAEQYCQLRTVVLESDEMTALVGKAFRDSLTLLVDKRLGPHRDNTSLGGGEIPEAKEGKIWNGPGTKVVVATSPAGKATGKEAKATGADGEEGAPSADSTKRPGRIFAVAYAPGSGAQDFDTWESRYNGEAAQRAADQQTRYRDVDSALVWAALPSVTADLKTVLVFLRNHDAEKPKELRPPQVDVALLRALKTIHDVGPSLPPPRRAAALLAGDVTLSAAQATQSVDSNSRIWRNLESLGISYEPLHGEESGYRNTRAWLWQAYQLDSTGRAGRAAFAELLGLTWPVTDKCNFDEYKRMIEHGEAELSKGDDNPLVHFYVGSAYKSIYDFANFKSSEFEATPDIKAQAESARLKAIEHFRAALASLPEPPLRREAWTKAMRLILRRSGEQPEYVCFPD